MKRRFVLGGMASAVALALALGLLQKTDRPAPRAPRAVDPTVQAAKDHPELARAMASYRVHEDPVGPAAFRGRGYRGDARPAGLRFEADGFFIETGAAALVTAAGAVVLPVGTVSRPAFGVARIDRGAVVEEYVFENRRVEQIFRIPQPVGPGELTVRASLRTDLGGKVIEVPRTGWLETPMQDGGLAFCDAHGTKRLAYHGAVAIDAAGRRQLLDAKWEGGQIALRVPETFMNSAVYPVVIDPWLELDFSGSGTGISNTPDLSQTPALALTGGTPYVAWAELAGGTHYQIYLRTWNGFGWFGIGASDTGDGLSATKGNATNPSVAVDPVGKIFVAWQDDTNIDVEIYLKEWDGSTWIELADSATAGGVSSSAGASTYPSVAFMEVTVPSTGEKSNVPVVAWQDLVTGSPAVHLAAFFPGDAGLDNDTANDAPPAAGNILMNPGVDENFPVIDAGWYGFGTSGIGAGNSYDYFVPGLSSTPLGLASERPRLIVQRVAGAWTAWVAWQDTRNSNYEIYSRKYVVPSDALYDRQSIRFPGKNKPVFTGEGLIPQPNAQGPVATNPRATASWVATGAGSDAAGGISASGTPSLFPSIAVDSAGNVFVAWEEEVSLADSEVFLSRSAGPAGAFSTPANVSQTPSTGPNSRSSNPSVAVDGSFVYVAWSDDQVGQTEIYVKRRSLGAAFPIVTGDFTVTTPGSGNPEVGFQSFSASIETPVSTTPGLTGVSKTTGASVFPQIKTTGSPVLVWQDFASGNFEIYVQQYFENQPKNLRQTDPLLPPGSNDITFGGSTTNSTIELRGTLFSEDTTRTLRMEVEVIPIPAGSAATIFQTSGATAVDPVTHLSPEVVVPVSGTVNVSYTWRARTVDNTGAASAWVSAGNNPDSAVDFSVLATAPPPNAATINVPLSFSNGAVHLTWTPPVGGADSFTVQRSDGSGFGVIVTGLSSSTTSFDDSGVQGGFTYTYIVTSVRGVAPTASSTDSAPAAITIPAGATPPDSVNKHRCGLAGAESLLLLGLAALLRRRRR